jgi:cobalt-zinc-cadmium efflux system membrane fusion protein
MKIFRIASLFVAAALFAGCHREAASDSVSAPKVAGETIQFTTNAPQLAYLAIEPAQEHTAAATGLYGRLAWNDDLTVRIYSPVAGRVLNSPVEVNQAVTAGDALALLDSPDFGQALADARTAVGNLAAADKAFDRVKELLAHGAAAQKDVESAEAAFVAARAEKDRAVARLANYGGTLASTNSIYALRSPLTGVLVEKSLTPGQEIRADLMLANAQQFINPQFVVTNPKKLWLFLDVDELTVTQLSPGQPVLIHTKAYPDKIFNGHLEIIGHELDPTTRTIKARCLVDNADGRLSAEMYVTADVTATAPAGVEISSKAIFLKDNQPYVFVETANGEFQRRAVKLGIESSGRTAIVGGVAAGDRVVSDGCLLLESILEGDNG